MATAELKLNFHEKQGIAFTSEATEIGYGGAVGGGKSFFLRGLMVWASSQIPGLKCFLFRKHYDELLRNHMDSTGGFRDMLVPWVEAGKAKILQDEIVFWNGSQIYLCQCSHQNHLQKHMGDEIHLLGIDQAEQFPERWLRFLRHRVRMTEEIKRKIPAPYQDRFPKVVYTFNPGGSSHNFFRRQFVKARMPFVVWQTPPAEGGFKRQFIPAFLADNPSLNAAEYTRVLEGLNDAQLVKALLHGDFDALVGNFFTQFDENLHVTPDFSPPSHWFKFRTFDWGSSDPFAVYWWCVSDGDRFIDGGGKERWFPRGALIAYREWYGCNAGDTARGLELRNEEVAEGIKSRTVEKCFPAVITDSLPFQDRGFGRDKKKYTIADEFEAAGVRLIKGNCARVYGWKQVRDRLIGKDGMPMLFFTESCIYARDYVPSLERNPIDPEDAVSDGEATHACDAIRLACTTRPFVIDKPREVAHFAHRYMSDTPRQILERMRIYE